MSNFIEDANLSSDRFVTALSRYRASKVIYYNVNHTKKIAFTTYKKQVSSIPTESDLYMVVPAGMEYRPDLVSQHIYGTVDLWWKIMEANNIKDVYDFKTGTNLRLPQNPF